MSEDWAPQAPPEEPQGGKSQQDAALPSERPSVEAHQENASGTVRVRTIAGHAVVPSDKSLPEFGAEGIDVTQEQADALVEDFPDYVYVDQKEV